MTTNQETKDELRVKECIIQCNCARVPVSLVTSELDEPGDHMYRGDKPDEAASPSMKACELVKVDLYRERDGQEGEGRSFECENDDERE